MLITVQIIAQKLPWACFHSQYVTCHCLHSSLCKEVSVLYCRYVPIFYRFRVITGWKSVFFHCFYQSQSSVKPWQGCSLRPIVQNLVFKTRVPDSLRYPAVKTSFKSIPRYGTQANTPPTDLQLSCILEQLSTTKKVRILRVDPSQNMNRRSF